MDVAEACSHGGRGGKGHEPSTSLAAQEQAEHVRLRLREKLGTPPWGPLEEEEEEEEASALPEEVAKGRWLA